MDRSNASGRQGGPLNPRALSVEDLARVLTSSGPDPVTVEMIQDDVADGAPTNPDGTIDLIQFAAWLLQEISRGGD